MRVGDMRSPLRAPA